MGTATFTWQTGQTIPAGIGQSIGPLTPATGEYITEFRVRRQGTIPWTYVVINSSDTCVTSLAINNPCSGTTLSTIGFCQNTHPTELHIAFWDN